MPPTSRGALGKPEAARLAASRDEFAADLHAAILAARDPLEDRLHPRRRPASAISTRPRRPSRSIPATSRRSSTPRMLDATFERYWTEFRRARVGRAGVEGLHALRNARRSAPSCGWAGATGSTRCSIFSWPDRRPAGWNQWAEVVGRDPREVRFIGDMPHALGGVRLHPLRRSTCSPGNGATTVRWCSAAGCRRTWLAGEGSAIRGLRDALRPARLRHARQWRAQRLRVSRPARAAPFRPPGQVFVLAVARWSTRPAPSAATGQMARPSKWPRMARTSHSCHAGHVRSDPRQANSAFAQHFE